MTDQPQPRSAESTEPAQALRSRGDWIVRVLYAGAAFLGSAATVITALSGWDRI